MNNFAAVKEVINEWDPVGLFPDAPDEEYESEIRDIIKHIPSVKTVDGLAVVIHEVFIEWFGEDTFTEAFSIKNCHPIALKIWKKINDDLLC